MHDIAPLSSESESENELKSAPGEEEEQNTSLATDQMIVGCYCVHCMYMNAITNVSTHTHTHIHIDSHSRSLCFDCICCPRSGHPLPSLYALD